MKTLTETTAPRTNTARRAAKALLSTPAVKKTKTVPETEADTIAACDTYHDALEQLVDANIRLEHLTTKDGDLPIAWHVQHGAVQTAETILAGVIDAAVNARVKAHIAVYEATRCVRV